MSIGPSVSCVCLFLCVISDQSIAKAASGSNLNKFDTFLHKHSKVMPVLRYQSSTSLGR